MYTYRLLFTVDSWTAAARENRSDGAAFCRARHAFYETDRINETGTNAVRYDGVCRQRRNRENYATFAVAVPFRDDNSVNRTRVYCRYYETRDVRRKDDDEWVARGGVGAEK